MDRKRDRRPLNGVIHGDALHRDAPYGAETVGKTDPQKLSDSLLQQLHQINPNAKHELNLFPEPFTVKYEGIAYKRNDKDAYHVNGISDGSDIFHYTENFRKVVPFKNPDQCASDQAKENRFEIKVFTALHETAHDVANSLQIIKGVSLDKFLSTSLIERNSASFPAPFYKRMFARNISERLADASASLYILSNYGSATDPVNVANLYKDIRQAIPEPTHYSSSTISAAQQAFAQNPRKGLSITQTTKWAAEIVSAQPNLVQEMVAADRAIPVVKGYADGGPETDNAIVDPYYTTIQDPQVIEQTHLATEARDRLCVPASAAKNQEVFTPKFKLPSNFRQQTVQPKP